MNTVDGKSRIVSNKWINSEYKHMVVDVGLNASVVVPGQFFNLLCPHSEGNKPFLRRPMSTYFADSQKGQVEFLYKVIGAGTQGLAELETGDMLGILGPLGKGFNLTEQDKHILVFGRGVGLATLAPLAEFAAKKNIKVTAILSAKDKQRLMSQHRFNDSGATVIEVVDSDDSSSIANVENIIRQCHTNQPFDTLFTCGSKRLLKLLQQLATEFNIRGEVALEQQMACGLGLCYSCVQTIKEEGQECIRSKKVCDDGPVFNIKEVVL